MTWHCHMIHEVATLISGGFAMSSVSGATMKSRNWPLEGLPGT